MASEATLMFLPGASGDRELWRPLSERLARHGKLRLFGWPGFGDLPSDPTVNGIADLAAQVSAEITGPVELFAQSMGGVIALLAALRKPEHVRHLVLSVTSGGIDLSGLGASDWRTQFRANNPTLPSWFEQERWDLSARLSEVRAPVLLLWGDADPISPVAVGERLKQLLPAAELVVVSGADHDLVASHVDEILPHVERHLAQPSNQ